MSESAQGLSRRGATVRRAAVRLGLAPFAVSLSMPSRTRDPQSPPPRTIAQRSGVGAAGIIIQRSDLTSHRVDVDRPTLILVEDGRKRIRWAGGECLAGPGEALAVQAGTVVDIANTPGRAGTYRALWIVWSPGLLEALGAEAGAPAPAVARHAALDPAFHDAFHRAFLGLDERDGLPVRIAIHRLQEVLLWLAERGFRFACGEPASVGRRVRRLLCTDPAAAWDMADVARRVATSVPTLRRRLAEERLNFRELVQDVRMSHALALLQNTDTPVLQVALASGYDSPSRFTARFRARYGFLPTDVRGERRPGASSEKGRP